MNIYEEYERDVAAATYVLVYFLAALGPAIVLVDVAPWTSFALLVVAGVGAVVSSAVRQWVRDTIAAEKTTK